jgi:hypothetical protein
MPTPAVLAITKKRFLSKCAHRESEIPQKAMSALPPKADMCGEPVMSASEASGKRYVRNKNQFLI